MTNKSKRIQSIAHQVFHLEDTGVGTFLQIAHNAWLLGGLLPANQ